MTFGRTLLFLFAAIFILILSLPSLEFAQRYAQLTYKSVTGQELTDADRDRINDPGIAVHFLNKAKALTRKNDTLNDTYLSDRRTVRVEFEVPFSSLLKDGETPPAAAFTKLYAEARGRPLLIQRCAEVLNTIARKCDLGHSNARVTEGGTVTLSGTLRFVPVTAPGKGTSMAATKPLHLNATLTKGRAVPDTTENRERLLTAAERACDHVRETLGNCAITSVVLKRSRSGHSNEPRFLRASASFTAYGNPSTVDRHALNKELSEIAQSQGL